MNAQEFIDKYDMSYQKIDLGLNPKTNMYEYSVALTITNKITHSKGMYLHDSTYLTNYFHGVALSFDVESALEAVARDFQTALLCPTFEEFADSYGYDPDSLSALRVFESLQQNSSKVEEWLSTEELRNDFLSVADEED